MTKWAIVVGLPKVALGAEVWHAAQKAIPNRPQHDTPTQVNKIKTSLPQNVGEQL